MLINAHCSYEKRKEKNMVTQYGSNLVKLSLCLQMILMGICYTGQTK